MWHSFSLDYHDIIKSADQRVGEWWLMDGPGSLICILALYYLVVRIVGPALMHDRPPLELKTIMTAYNSLQVFACALVVQQTVKYIKSNNVVVIGCGAVDYSDNPNAVQLARMCWWYLMLKLLDLVETVFFVLRKRSRQVSNLHLYHHISTPLFSWVMVKFAAGGTPSIYVALNSAIHVLMYTYYLFTGIGMGKALAPWKKYLTLIQMAQFCVVMVHAMQFVRPDCHVPKPLGLVFIPNVALVYYMFANFYREAYGKRGPSVFEPNLNIMVDNRPKKTL